MTGVRSFIMTNRGPEPLLVGGVGVTPFPINPGLQSTSLTAGALYTVVVQQSGAEVFNVEFAGPGRLTVIPKTTPYPVLITAELA